MKHGVIKIYMSFEREINGIWEKLNKDDKGTLNLCCQFIH